MRYIIEAALLQAELLNRTLVLPSFVYARACEYDTYVTLSYLASRYTYTFLHLQYCLRGICAHGQQRRCFRIG